MNSYKIKFMALLIVGMGLSFSACKDYLDVNIDPNQSVTSRVDLQLSAAQLQISIGMGQRMYPNLAIWSQYWSGGPGVSLGDPDQHKLASSEGNEIFRTMYRSNVNLNYIVQNSTSNYYVGIAKILRAYNFQVCADLFGDIPYTDALKGDINDGSILHPKYDSAKDVVYPGIEAELKDAIRLIEATGTFTIPGADDLIYGGDMVKWDKFAHTLLLKVYLRQGASGETKARDLYGSDEQFILTNDEAGKVPFPGGSSASNPFWNSAKSTALGNYYVATTTVLEYLTATADPRIDKFFDRNGSGAHYGVYPGNIQNEPPTASFSRPAGALAATGGLIFSPTAPVFLISAWESNLLLAEAAARNWTTGGKALESYEAGVKANYEYLGLPDSVAVKYLASPGGAYDANNAIKTIALQKWTCMNGTQPIESWTETRRFDTPSQAIFASAGGLFKSPTKNALGAGLFPSLLPYPENEESLNQSFPGQHQITDKVFWDN
jgi:hypothetical protein